MIDVGEMDHRFIESDGQHAEISDIWYVSKIWLYSFFPALFFSSFPPRETTVAASILVSD